MYGGKKRKNDQHDSQGNHNAKEQGKVREFKGYSHKRIDFLFDKKILLEMKIKGSLL